MCETESLAIPGPHKLLPQIQKPSWEHPRQILVKQRARKVPCNASAWLAGLEAGVAAAQHYYLQVHYQ